jgi:hypothetical protein
MLAWASDEQREALKAFRKGKFARGAGNDPLELRVGDDEYILLGSSWAERQRRALVWTGLRDDVRGVARTDRARRAQAARNCHARAPMISLNAAPMSKVGKSKPQTKRDFARALVRRAWERQGRLCPVCRREVPSI